MQVTKATGGPQAMLEQRAQEVLAAEMERGKGLHAIPHPAILSAAFRKRAPCRACRLARSRMTVCGLAPR